jgi:hypothetical protein
LEGENALWVWICWNVTGDDVRSKVHQSIHFKAVGKSVTSDDERSKLGYACVL